MVHAFRPAPILTTTPIIPPETVPNQPPPYQPIIDWYFDHHKRISKVVAIVLALQGLYALFISTKFILVDSANLNQQLAAHQITAAEVNFLANKATMMVVSTVVSGIVALHIWQKAKILSVILGIVFVIGNNFISQLLHFLGTDQLLITLVVNSITSLFGFSKQVNEEVEQQLQQLPLQ